MTGVHNAELSDLENDDDSSKCRAQGTFSKPPIPTGADLGEVITKVQCSNVAERAASIERLETIPKVDDKDMFTDPSRLDEAQGTIPWDHSVY
jgi:hypothetical protein